MTGNGDGVEPMVVVTVNGRLLAGAGGSETTASLSMILSGCTAVLFAGLTSPKLSSD